MSARNIHLSPSLIDPKSKIFSWKGFTSIIASARIDVTPAQIVTISVNVCILLRPYSSSFIAIVLEPLIEAPSTIDLHSNNFISPNALGVYIATMQFAYSFQPSAALYAATDAAGTLIIDPVAKLNAFFPSVGGVVGSTVSVI